MVVKFTYNFTTMLYNEKMIRRSLAKFLSKTQKSILLLGPRQTGKSTLIQGLQPDLSINFARENIFLDYSSQPNLLPELLKANKARTIFIDEVQRLPSILNTIQALIDDYPGQYKFYLTGSSARKLKRGNANLLPGRVLLHYLGPLCSAESNYELNTAKALMVGTLPEPYLGAPGESMKLLRSYAATYLREEVQAEALTKNLEGFSRFLFIIAEQVAGLLDLSKASNQAKVPRQTALRFLEILEDTLLVHRIWPYPKVASADLVKHPKLYFFDVGVLNGLLGSFEVGQDRKGALFEQLFLSQLFASAAAADVALSVWSFRTRGGLEIDFLVEVDGKKYAIEVNSGRSILTADLKGLLASQKYLGKSWEYCLAYTGESERLVEGVHVRPWQTQLKKMGL